MERLKCIICNSDKSTQLHDLLDRYTGDSFHLEKCECGFTFLNPRPTASQIGQYYNFDMYDPHTASNKMFDRVYNFIKGLVFYYRFNLLKRYCANDINSLLDIGAGKGDFAKFCKNRGCNVTIQDILKFDSKKEIRYTEKLSEITVNNSFNSISLWHSLEHIHDTRQLFKDINRLSSKNATLFIAIPNRMSIDSIIYKEKWVGWDAPRHLYHFSYNDINKLLNEHGWYVYTSKILYQDTFYNSLLSLDKNILRIAKFTFHSIFMLLSILINSNFSSSKLYICKKQ